MLRRLDSTRPEFAAELDALLDLGLREDPEVQRAVVEIIAEVREHGDAALLALTEKLDGWAREGPQDLEVNAEAIERAFENTAPETRQALQLAHDRIQAYHARQTTEPLSYTDELGNQLGQRWTPVDRAGIYVPGGRAAYPSSVLMTVVPAKCAGVEEVVLVTPTPGGERNEAVLAAAHVAGVDRLFCIGGAQAVAALAYGTETVPRVDKIVGPGNAYVAAAKRQVFGQVGIDSIAGPSEVLVIADASASPDWVALDLFSQAEHDEVAQALLISADPAVLDAVEHAVAERLPHEPRRDIIEASLQARGALIQVRDLDEAAEVANRIAAEHVELMVAEPRELADKVRHAGALFIGSAAAEVLGDYVAGPSHVLPTYGTARFSSPLSVYDFKKRTSIIDLSSDGARQLAGAAEHLASVEGLHAHAAAAALRKGSNS